MSVTKRKGAEFLWFPESQDGAIVGIVEWDDHIIIACQYGLYKMNHDLEVDQMKIKEKAK